jgi:hypothetical protein
MDKRKVQGGYKMKKKKEGGQIGCGLINAGGPVFLLLNNGQRYKKIFPAIPSAQRCLSYEPMIVIMAGLYPWCEFKHTKRRPIKRI